MKSAIGTGPLGIKGRTIGTAGETGRHIERCGLTQGTQCTLGSSTIDGGILRVQQGRTARNAAIGAKRHIDLNAQLIRTRNITRQNPVRINLVEDGSHLRASGLRG